MYNLWERFKGWVAEIVKSRAFIELIVFCVLSAVLIQRVFYLQIVKGQDYLDNYKLQIQKTKEVQGTRGRILDRNGVVLADNKLAYSVTIEDNGEYSTTEEKNQIINETIERVIDIVESRGDTIIRDFKIVIGDSGEYEFTMDEGTQRLRFLADIFGYATIDKLSDKQKESTAADIIHFLCAGDEKSQGYGLDEEKMSKEEILKMVNIRYAMGLNRFQKYVATVIASDVSEETTAAIMENMDTLQGVNIAEDSLRVYPDSKYFASILGYTGQISQEEYDALDKETQKKYSLTDIVGKAGLEQSMDEELQGTKGEIKLYVNNVGKVIETTKGKEARAGNDLVLSIDSNLQKAAYDLLEEKLAGILLAKMSNVMNYDRTQVKEGSDVIIPVDDVYNAFFANEILDVSHFEEDDAGSTEKSVAASFLSRKEEVLSLLMNQLENVNAPAYKDCEKEVQAYLSYIASNLLTTNAKVIVSDKIDKEDAAYKAWNDDETVSLYTYLNDAISRNWVDTSKLSDYMGENNSYTDLNEVYQAMVKFIEEEISTDSEFDKLIYKYMIKTQRITGTQICMMLYEQNVLKYDETQYQNLASGAVSPYDFVRGKIQTLEITPGELGLEPCTGSVVVTDVNTGEVLACVSYPGYDNNRLANSMDSEYYSKLRHNQAAPLFNNATQEKTAPGSTYKPLVAIAGLTEGVITTGDIISCNGPFEKITPSPKCWVYPNSHGGLNVEGAIQNSCNNYFFEVGYRLGETTKTVDGKTQQVYSSDAGLKKLQTYAEMFGLNATSGVEIPESEPQISDEDSVRSAIGQGTNNYTTAQLARYITAVANRGTVYDLTLLGESVTSDGKQVKDYQASVRNVIEDVSASAWNAAQSGMRRVVTSSSTYNSLGGFAMSGKTGTAQQSKTHPDHGLFVGFAPSDDPEIAFAIRIKNGYESLYPSEIGRDLIRYYYGLASREEIITGQAAEVSVSAVHGD